MAIIHSLLLQIQAERSFKGRKSLFLGSIGDLQCICMYVYELSLAFL